jgi:hypothetical protein
MSRKSDGICYETDGRFGIFEMILTDELMLYSRN